MNGQPVSSWIDEGMREVNTLEQKQTSMKGRTGLDGKTREGQRVV